MKRLGAILLTIVILAALCGCAKREQAAEKTGLRVVCSLFPVYSFARSIAGEYAQVSQLLPPGMDSHDYEPSAGDMAASDKADLFIYTDDELETWISVLRGGFTHVKVVRCAEGIDLEALNEQWEKTGENHTGAEGHHSDHGHKYDAHIWLDPTLAVAMCENIRDALSQADEAHREQYAASCKALCDELTQLDAEFRALFDAHPDAILYFGGKFAYSHFLRHYGVKYDSAYDDCSDEGEPGLGAVVRIINAMKAGGGKIIFTDELSSGQIASEIARETGAEVRLFHTGHSVSAEESGKTYLDIMRQNLQVITEALNK